MIWIWDWTTSLTLFCWFVAALGQKEPSQPGEIIPFLFQFFYYTRIASPLLWLFFGEIGTHPNAIFLQLVRFRGWVVMKNNKTCNAPKCLKPSGLIDWVNCRLWNRWVQIKCANLSKTEARGFAEFKCCRCSLVNTIPQCHDDNFRPDTLFNWGVVHWKRVPKISRIPLAENLIPKTNDICEIPTKIALWCILLSSLSCFFLKNHLEEVNVRSHHSVR